MQRMGLISAALVAGLLLAASDGTAGELSGSSTLGDWVKAKPDDRGAWSFELNERLQSDDKLIGMKVSLCLQEMATPRNRQEREAMPMIRAMPLADASAFCATMIDKGR